MFSKIFAKNNKSTTTTKQEIRITSDSFYFKFYLTFADKNTFFLLSDSQNREHQKYLWNVIVLRGEIQ